jgi:hypothetical protein
VAQGLLTIRILAVGAAEVILLRTSVSVAAKGAQLSASVPSQRMSLSTLWIRNSSESGFAASAWSAWPASSSTPVPATARLVLCPRTARFRASSCR